MAFINTETGKIGTLREHLPNVSSPHLLSEEEIAAYNLEKYVKPVEVIELTLAELIEKKIEESSKECQAYIYSVYPLYKQTSALGGVYSEAENTEIITWCKTKVQNFIAWKTHLATLLTKEEVEACNWRTVTYDEETLEVLSETFWEV